MLFFLMVKSQAFRTMNFGRDSATLVTDMISPNDYQGIVKNDEISLGCVGLPSGDHVGM